MAGASTICIAAASGTVESQVQLAAHQESAPIRVVTQDYKLAASVNPLALAELPFQYYFTIASTLGNLAAFVPPVNAATGAFFQGQFEKIPPLLQQAIAAEVKAVQAVIALPATLVGGLGALSTANALAKSDATKSAAIAPTAGNLVPIAELPFQLYFTVASTLGNLAAFVAPVNAATGAFFQGQFEKIPPLLQKAFTDELAAINKVLALPATVVSTIGSAISGGLATSALTTTRSSIEQQALTAALSTDTSTEKSTVTKTKGGVTDTATSEATSSAGKTGQGATATDAKDTTGTTETGTKSTTGATETSTKSTTGATGNDAAGAEKPESHTGTTGTAASGTSSTGAKDSTGATGKDTGTTGKDTAATGSKDASGTSHKKDAGGSHKETKKAQHAAKKK
ncbi:hypothetical protein ACGFK1_18935 [Mycobacterium sp. NPDC048908]|uniref:hypothetical protein n=1 Tax=Mycobacterium sp. NPDC048908 TaxID=3364292 RepID=UPI0037228C28